MAPTLPLKSVRWLPLLVSALVGTAVAADPAPAPAAATVSAYPIHYRVASLHDDRVAGEGTEYCTLELHLFGAGAVRAMAARVVVTSATDDTGGELEQRNASTQFRTFSESGTLRPIFVQLSTPARTAKTLSVSGRVELFVPSLDPDAGIDVTDLPAKAGSSIKASALKKAGVQIVPLSLDASHRTLPSFDSGLSDDDLDRFAGGLRRLAPTDVMLAVRDPDERIVSLDICNAKGAPMSRGRSTNVWNDWQQVVLHLPTPVTPDSRLICTLLTDKAVVTVPFTVNGVELP